MRIIYILIPFTFLIITSCNKQKETQKGSDNALGVVDFSVSGLPEALPHFEKGLLLLHSFEYADSRQAFQEAIEIDPSFAMAYWGKAMTYNHSLWRSQNKEKAVEVLDALSEKPEDRVRMAATQVEKDFIRSVNILYGEGTKFERDQLYKDHLYKMHQQYPKNNEVAAFYALSLLGSVEVGRDDEVYGKGANIAEGILKENPNHPGALHYLIHSYDDPYHAYKAIQAADSYSVVAPDAAHALHMPSHIYVALGMWDNVISSNIDSWNASVNRMKKKELDNDAQSYHALHWLMYGYLQKEMLEPANEIMEDMVVYCNELPSRRARSYLLSLKGAYLVETDSWGGEFADIPVDCKDLNISLRGMDYYIQGMNAYAREDKDKLAEIIAVFEKDRKQAEVKAFNDGVPVCSVGGYAADNPNKLDVDQALVMEMELKAMAAMMDGNTESAEEWLKTASQLEESISYSYGPPPILKPSHELYAEWLLVQKRDTEAVDMFNKSLERGPNRILSLKGKYQAAKNLGDTEMMEEVKTTIEEVLKSQEYKNII